MNTVTIDVRELPGRLSELMLLAAEGAEVLVQDGGVTAKLVALAERKWILGMHPGSMVMREDFNDPMDEEKWMDG